MKVRATQEGFFANEQKYVDDQFEIQNESQLGSWMEPVGWKPGGKSKGNAGDKGGKSKGNAGDKGGKASKGDADASGDASGGDKGGDSQPI